MVVFEQLLKYICVDVVDATARMKETARDSFNSRHH
jgi:hypothetical protein